MTSTFQYRMFTEFDRNIFKKNWKKINETPFKRAGLWIRRTAIRSLRKPRGKKSATRNKPSHAPQPPYSRMEPQHPMRRIFSVPNLLGTNVVVGPIWLGSNPPVPAIHEHGLAVVRNVIVDRGNVSRNNRGHYQRGRPIRGRKIINYPKRQFMQRALDKAIIRNVLPPMWRGSLNKLAA